MDWDDVTPKAKPTAFAVGEALDALSVAELEARVAALASEIERLSGEIKIKKAHSAAAASLFKS